MVDLVEPALFVSIPSRMQFSGYQYGGRPLGLSFVKYQTPGGGGDAMETEATSLTQDQIM
jgi:hypothetical protein